MSRRNKHISDATLLTFVGAEDLEIYKEKLKEYDSIADDLVKMELAIKEIRDDIDPAKDTKYWVGSYIVRRRLEMRYLIKLENKIAIWEKKNPKELFNGNLLVEYDIN